MSDGNTRKVSEWLAAQAEGRDEEAERLFFALFVANVPRLAPSPRLADRVMAAMSPLQRPAAGRVMPWWGRAAVLALLSAGGLGALSFWTISVFDLLYASWALTARAAGVAAAVAGALIYGWSEAAAIARPLTLIATSGPGAAVLAAHLALAAAASFALKRVLSLEEEVS